MILFIIISIAICILFYFYFRNEEKWCNTYSGWPGPLESPFRSNIPALYGNPKYMSGCKYNSDPNSKTGYFSMKNLPN
jgi:hypothetical protein